jgi:acyl-CoA thioesterase
VFVFHFHGPTVWSVASPENRREEFAFGGYVVAKAVAGLKSDVARKASLSSSVLLPMSQVVR